MVGPARQPLTHHEAMFFFLSFIFLHQGTGKTAAYLIPILEKIDTAKNEIQGELFFLPKFNLLGAVKDIFAYVRFRVISEDNI